MLVADVRYPTGNLLKLVIHEWIELKRIAIDPADLSDWDVRLLISQCFPYQPQLTLLRFLVVQKLKLEILPVDLYSLVVYRDVVRGRSCAVNTYREL